jgi:tetratricopeptide (TPR) repeat protein
VDRLSATLELPAPTTSDIAPTGWLRGVEDPNRSWELTGSELTLGSRRDNDLIIRDLGVSRLHAHLLREDGGWIIQDAGSRHGVLVNDERVSRHRLEEGDEVMIGVVVMRFESQDEPEVLPLPSESSDRFTWTWPAALDFVEPKHRRPAIAAAGVALVFALIVPSLLGSGGSGMASPTAFDSQSAHASLLAGDYRVAEKAFRRLASRAPMGERKAPRILERVAQVWIAKAKGPEEFRWDTAAEQLERAAALEGLPSETRAWIDEQAPWVENGRIGYAALVGARGAVTEAQTQLAGDDPEGAADALESGLSELAGVPRAGPLSAELTAVTATLRTGAYAALTTLANARMTAAEPDYDAALTFIERAEEYATESESKRELQRLADTARRNRDDELRCASAVEHLSTRQLERYDDALALLNQIDQRSMIYQEAQAWAKWAVADTKTRRAEALYAQGHVQDALRILDEAEATGVDENALRAIRERRDRWSQAGTAYLRGRDLNRSGHPEQATKALETVLAVEPDRGNKFRQRAETLLDQMVRSDRASQRLTLHRGLRALKRGDYSAANRAFESIRKDPGRKNKDGGVIAKAVRLANAERGLLARSRRTLHVDAVERFPELRDVLMLLRRWLHRQNPDRDEAIKYLDVVERRLKNRATGASQRS